MNRPEPHCGKIVRIGGASGYWGDTASGPRQLVARGRVDYLAFDYLAESTMAVLAKAKSRNPRAGHATDFVELAMQPLLPKIIEQRIRVIANAGGVNLSAALAAVEETARMLGLRVRVAMVEGDDLLDRAESYRARGVHEMRSGKPLPARLESINAYLGALPIAAALAAGADVVLTGRCVDSALILGPLIHEFGWSPKDFDRLAAGSLCGHLLECGAQVTGGNFTDWQETAAGWSDMGFPIAEVSADGSFVVTKPEDTGGCVTRLTVAEQLLYEIGDPRAYLLPDVTCDFSDVRLEEIGRDRVRVTGARGRAPTSTLKVCATYFDGYACRASTSVVGAASAQKARRMGAAILAKTDAELRLAGMPIVEQSTLDVLGDANELQGTQDASHWSCSVLRLAVRHPQASGAEIFAREFAGAGLSMSPGLAPLAPGRPGVSPLIQMFSFLLDKSEVSARVRIGETDVAVIPFAGPYVDAMPSMQSPAAEPLTDRQEMTVVPLIAVAVARSGDKGDDANIGVIARRAEWLPYVRASLDPESVLRRFAGFGARSIERYDLPGPGALNFVLRSTLGGGGAGSLHHDALAKTFAQRLLEASVLVPSSLLRGTSSAAERNSRAGAPS